MSENQGLIAKFACRDREGFVNSKRAVSIPAAIPEYSKNGDFLHMGGVSANGMIGKGALTEGKFGKGFTRKKIDPVIHDKEDQRRQRAEETVKRHIYQVPAVDDFHSEQEITKKKTPLPYPHKDNEQIIRMRNSRFRFFQDVHPDPNRQLNIVKEGLETKENHCAGIGSFRESVILGSDGANPVRSRHKVRSLGSLDNFLTVHPGPKFDPFVNRRNVSNIVFG